MLKLTDSELDNALAAINAHGYSDFFPEPPEFRLLTASWPEIRRELSNQDLDLYQGYDVLGTFAPKSRVNVRRVALLHPYDLIFYTGLVLALKEEISEARAATAKRCFSYRADGAGGGILYADSPNYREFRETISAHVASSPDCYVGVTDIADFYPRIYQHRLVNALQAAVPSSKYEYVRVLEKLLNRFSENVSYGIPIGPPASRPLGEIVLVDVDSTLLSFGVDFVRFTDDYVIFGDTPEEAEYGIRILGETLFSHHGLTLQTAKTRILKGHEYVEHYLMAHSEKEEAHRKLLDLIGDYDEAVSYEGMDDEQKQQIDALNLSEMLNEALAEGHNVDFREVSFILSRLSALEKPDLIPIVLGNLERLSPVAHSIATFLRQFSQLEKSTREEAAEALLRPILNGSKYVSEYYIMWILSIFAEDPAWNNAGQIFRIFREAPNDTVRRFAALALGTSGTRTEAIGLKPYLQSASSLARTAILLTSKKMGQDERRCWRQSLKLEDSLEKLCIA